MVLWLSSTVHSAMTQQKERVKVEEEGEEKWRDWRFVVYTCYRPKEECDVCFFFFFLFLSLSLSFSFFSFFNLSPLSSPFLTPSTESSRKKIKNVSQRQHLYQPLRTKNIPKTKGTNRLRCLCSLSSSPLFFPPLLFLSFFLFLTSSPG